MFSSHLMNINKSQLSPHTELSIPIPHDSCIACNCNCIIDFLNGNHNDYAVVVRTSDYKPNLSAIAITTTHFKINSNILSSRKSKHWRYNQVKCNCN